MKNLAYWGLSGFVLFGCSAFAAVPAEGWYGGLMATASYPPSVGSNSNTHPEGVPLANAELSYGLGGGGGGQIGYRLCNVRLEGELFYDYNPYHKITTDGFAFKRHFTAFGTPDFGLKMNGYTGLGAGLVNALYEIFDEDDDPRFIPYLGLGLGYASLQNKIEFYTITSSTGVVLSASGSEHSNSIVGQAILGLSYFYNDNLSFSTDYRYLTTKHIAALDSRVQVHTLNLAFNYTFSER